MRVRSVVDIHSKFMLFAAIAAMLALSVVMTLGLRLTPAEAMLGFSVVLLASGFLLWLLYGTYYELREDCLYCRSGPFVEVIPYDCIKKLSLSDNTLSSMAPSIKRIAVQLHCSGYLTNVLMISPKSRELFMARLKQRCVNLDITYRATA